jgi:hypothetical protein
MNFFAFSLRRSYSSEEDLARRAASGSGAVTPMTTSLVHVEQERLGDMPLVDA